LLPASLLNIDALAERLGVSVRFVRRMVEERRVPYFKLGRLVRFDAVEVEAWLISHHVEPPTLSPPGRRCH
jgi:excisionase family DNA binding protein